ncbi:unnamed protein product [Calicophoron daubneyi]|uniref:BAT2 N-terminal domain-containing protein n=1 Tax=Calicophoron daubneyi TaxID=300641 RepID=A0AAV2TUR6_CALDB
MSSKVSKSEKTKLKFAQSNINHVYRGNTTETHHKPTVRQYGMQVVGKLQGTRRLPPPAWVPSLKAETGGLDSRVTLVPPGGGGWGAPSAPGESAPAQASDAASTEMGGVVVTTTVSSMNGALSRGALGTSFEPAYAKSNFSTSVLTTSSSNEQKVIPNAAISQAPLPTEGKESQVSPSSDIANATATSHSGAWSLRSQNAAASGGLAANKPFFQRPAPVVSSAAPVSPVSKVRESKPSASSIGGGASEVVGEPSGWAALSEEEPNFDEQILFSDEEESQEDSKSTMKNATNGKIEQLDTTPSASKSSTPANPPISALSTSERSGLYGSPEYPPTSSGVGNEASNFTPSEAWSSSTGIAGFNGLTSHAISRPSVSNLSYTTPMSTTCVLVPEKERLISGSQYFQPSAPSHPLSTVFPDPYFSGQMSATHMVTSSTGLTEPNLPASDIDTEIQHAQRQARTQEFKSAVERAQQARMAHPKGDAYHPETDNLLQRSVVTLLSDHAEAKNVNTLSGPLSQPMNSVPPAHPVVPPLLGNMVNPQLLLSSVYQQAAGQNRPDVAAALAAATAAAMAYGGITSPGKADLSVGSPNVGLALQALSAPSHSVVSPNSSNAWHGPLGMTSSTTAPGIPPIRPVTPVIPNAFAVPPGGPQGSGSAAHPHAVYLDPDFFVERFLEILNQQQISRPSNNPSLPNRTVPLNPPATVASKEADVHLDSQTFINAAKASSGDESAVSGPRFKIGEFSTADVDELSSQLESTLKTDTPQSDHGNQPPADGGFVAQCDRLPSEQVTEKSRTKRVPGLMDVKVSSTTTRNLAYLWEQEDYLSENPRATRGRARFYTSDKSRGRGRRPTARPLVDDANSTRTKSSAVDSRYFGNSYGGYQGVQSWQSSKAVPHARETTTKKRQENPNQTATDTDFKNRQSNEPKSTEPRFGDKNPTDSEGGEYADLSDIAEDDASTSLKKQDGSDRHAPAKRHTKPNSEDTADDVPYVPRREYPRRPDRGRRGQGVLNYHYTSSRKFSSDDTAAYYGRYGTTDQKYYSRSGRSGSFTSRGHRSVVTSDGPDPRRKRNPEETRASERGVTSSRGARKGNGDDSDGHAREVAEEQGEKQFTQSRSNPVGPDQKRHSSYQRSRTVGQFTAGEFCDDYHLSDGEHHPQGNRQQHTRISRNRSYERQKSTRKNSPRRPLADSNNDKDGFGISDSFGNELPCSTDQQTKDKPSSFGLCPLLTDEFDDSDIPTVRVPAADTSFRFSRAQYNYSRTGRSGPYQRGAALRRATRTNSSQQQSKRTVQGSRRYKEMRDRYRDGKDGDGGAAAGANGRAVSGGGGSAFSGAGGNVCADGSADMSGGQNDGGQHESPQHLDDASQLSKKSFTSDTTGSHPLSHSERKSTTFKDDCNDNNRLEFGHSKLQQNFRVFVPRENVSDPNDCEEWETATEGSSDPDSGCGISSCQDTTTLICESSKTSESVANNTTPTAEIVKNFKSSGVSAIVTVGNTISTEPAVVISSVTHSRSWSSIEGRTSGRGHYLRIECGGGGGSGETRDYPVRGPRNRTGDQRYHRLTVSKFHNSAYVHKSSTNLSSIPPLMSIKPQGPFTRSPQSFDAVFGTVSRPIRQCIPEKASSTCGDADTTDNAHTSPNLSQDEDEDSYPSDGFTKVVSKASKRLARKRLQQELSSSRKTVRNVEVESKSPGAQPARYPSAITRPNGSDRASYSHSTSGAKSQSAQSSTNSRKPKLFHSKPTFMGPPLTATTVAAAAITVSSCGKLSTPSESTARSSAKSPSTSYASNVTSVSVTTTRTWSKVVGTRSINTAVAMNESGNVISNPIESVDVVWHSARTSGEVNEENLKSHISATTKTDSISSKSDGPTGCPPCAVVNAVQPFWSSESSENVVKTNEGKQRVVCTVSVTPSSGSNTSATACAASSQGGTTTTSVSNNICKVRPQQQQSSLQATPVTNSGTQLQIVSPVSPGSANDAALCGSEVTSGEVDRPECDYDSNVRQHITDAGHSSAALVSSPVTWTPESGLTQAHAFYSNRSENQPTAAAIENPFSPHFWQNVDHPFDVNAVRLAPGTTGNPMHPQFTRLPTSDVNSNLVTGTSVGSSLAAEINSKASHQLALGVRNQPYPVQPYGHNPSPSNDVYTAALYGNSLDITKLAPHVGAHTQQANLASVGNSVYVPQQQPSVNTQPPNTQSFPVSWTLSSNQSQLAQSGAHPQRYRQRIAHQMDPSYGSYAFQPELQNDYSFLPSATGCVQPTPSGGLLSAIHGQTQSNFTQNTARQVLGPSAAVTPWSLLGTPNGGPNLQSSTAEYNSALAAASGVNAGPGLLPHPVPHGGYNNAQCSFPPISSPSSNFVNHSNYVGVIGGGRPNTDPSSGPSRQRNVQQNIYSSHNLSHSSAPGQQPFQMHSAFYPSLSPSHQRIHLQQFSGSQGRNSLMSSQTGLFAAAFGPPTHPPNQATPPPLQSQLAYTNTLPVEATVAPSLPYHSSAQSHTFSNFNLQAAHPHIHGHRQSQSSGPHIPSRNVSTIGNHSGSPLMIPAPIGPSAVSALAGYTQPAPSASTSVSGYPLKPVLPTL